MARPARDPRARALQEFAAYDRQREKEMARIRGVLNETANDLAKLSRHLQNGKGRRIRRVK